jgi:hypothetical protein
MWAADNYNSKIVIINLVTQDLLNFKIDPEGLVMGWIGAVVPPQ